MFFTTSNAVLRVFSFLTRILNNFYERYDMYQDLTYLHLAYLQTEKIKMIVKRNKFSTVHTRRHCSTFDHK